LLSSAAFAQSDQKSAESTAANFLKRLDKGDLSYTYKSDLSPRFKSTFNESAFLQNAGVIRIQAGGAASTRKHVGGQALDHIPRVSGTGSFYYVRHYAAFPSATVFQDVYLEKVSGAWKVVGFTNVPAPPQ
jgi:hypothetical protein